MAAVLRRLKQATHNALSSTFKFLFFFKEIWLLRGDGIAVVRTGTRAELFNEGGRRVLYGKIVAQEGNKLEIVFEHAGSKKVLDSFVS